MKHKLPRFTRPLCTLQESSGDTLLSPDIDSCSIDSDPTTPSVRFCRSTFFFFFHSRRRSRAPEDSDGEGSGVCVKMDEDEAEEDEDDEDELVDPHAGWEVEEGCERV